MAPSHVLTDYTNDNDNDIAGLRAATEAFIADHIDGECTCLDHLPSLFILPGENFHRSRDNKALEISIERAATQCAFDIIDELVTPDMFLHENAIQMSHTMDGGYGESMGTSIRSADSTVKTKIMGPTGNSSAYSPQIGAFFDIERQSFVGYIALEQLFYGLSSNLGDDDDAGPSTPQPAELAYFDVHTQRMVAYTAFNQLQNVSNDVDGYLPRIHSVVDDILDSNAEEMNAQEIPSPSYDNTLAPAQLPNLQDSALQELDNPIVSLTTSNPRSSRVHAGHGAHSIATPRLSPVREEPEPPSSQGSSAVSACGPESLKPLSVRRSSFLSVSTEFQTSSSIKEYESSCGSSSSSEFSSESSLAFDHQPDNAIPLTTRRTSFLSISTAPSSLTSSSRASTREPGWRDTL